MGLQSLKQVNSGGSVANTALCNVAGLSSGGWTGWRVLRKMGFVVAKRCILAVTVSISMSSTSEQPPAQPGPSGGAEEGGEKKPPVTIICIGMAGSVCSSFILAWILTDNIGKDHSDATAQLLPAFQRHAALYPQLGSGRHAYAIHGEH